MKISISIVPALVVALIVTTSDVAVAQSTVGNNGVTLASDSDQLQQCSTLGIDCSDYCNKMGTSSATDIDGSGGVITTYCACQDDSGNQRNICIESEASYSEAGFTAPTTETFYNDDDQNASSALSLLVPGAVIVVTTYLMTSI